MDGRYADVNADDELLVHDQHVIAAVQAVTAAIAAGIVVSGSVALDAGTLAALETINAVVTGSVSVSNFPASVALDAATLAALETINAVVSGTVALDAGTLTALETITVANMIPAVETGLAKEVTLATRLSEAAFTARVPDKAGTWGYNGGASGTVTLVGGKKVLKITAIALEGAGSVQIDGGDIVPIPYGAADQVSSDLTITPEGNLIDPVIDFVGTDAYFVEHVT